ncbi:MAG: hypothetical protein NTX96_00670 [Candidatus Zambryskibacteria bacterium]|nr:hypothetical protein [Candidatus Zambryskibacteria bacterium]
MKIKIKSKYKKDKYIYETFLKNKKAKSLVIFSSGLSGSKELPLFKNASKKFLKDGFSILRFNFCRDNDDKLQKIDTLKPEELSLSVYIAELKNIMDVFSKKYPNIVLIGHSFGAVVFILFLDKYKKYKKNTKLILWDPTLLPWKKKIMEMDFLFNTKKQLYYGKNTNEVMNKTFYNECIHIKNTTNTLKMLNKEVCIIAAENGASKDAKKYYSKIKNKKNSKLFIIKKTGHRFDEEKAQKELFDRTIEFLK